MFRYCIGLGFVLYSVFFICPFTAWSGESVMLMNVRMGTACDILCMEIKLEVAARTSLTHTSVYEQRYRDGATTNIALDTMVQYCIRNTAKDTAYQLLVLNARVFFMFISCLLDVCYFFFFLIVCSHACFRVLMSIQFFLFKYVESFSIRFPFYYGEIFWNTAVVLNSIINRTVFGTRFSVPFFFCFIEA